MLETKVGSATQTPSRDPGPDQREKEEGRGVEEADGGEGSPGEAQGGGTQQTDTGNEGKTQVKDRTIVLDMCIHDVLFLTIIFNNDGYGYWIHCACYHDIYFVGVGLS